MSEDVGRRERWMMGDEPRTRPGLPRPSSAVCVLSPLLLLAALAAMPAQAQVEDPARGETLRIEAQVTYVAGQNAYLDAGTEAGLATGDTLTALREERTLGRLHVVSATADRAVVAFAGDPFPLTLGDRLVLLKEAAAPAPAPPPVVEAPPAPPDRPSILDQPTAEARTPALQPALSGRLQVGIDGLASSTRAATDGPSFSRTFARPFVALRAAAEHLPGGLRLDANLRTAYRYADPTPYDRPADVRVYQLSAEKAFGGVEARVGRFSNRYDRFSGYWDGLLLHAGSRDRGVGLAAGFQPDYADEAPSADLPKYTAFAHYAFALPAGAEAGDPGRAGGARVEVTALGGQVLPRAEGLATRTFAGVLQTAYARGLSLSSELLVDRDPASGDWVLSRLGGRVSATVAPGVRLSAFAQSRRPYLLLDDLQFLLNRSTRVGGGASVAVSGVTLRGDVSRASAAGVPGTLSASGGFSVPRLPGAGVGLSASATVWTQDAADGTRRGVYGSAGLDRSFGPLYAHVGYRYQQSPLTAGEALVSHGLDALLQVPLSPRVALTLQASTLFGDRLSSTRLYTALWYRL